MPRTGTAPLPVMVRSLPPGRLGEERTRPRSRWIEKRTASAPAGFDSDLCGRFTAVLAF